MKFETLTLDKAWKELTVVSESSCIAQQEVDIWLSTDLTPRTTTPYCSDIAFDGY